MAATRLAAKPAAIVDMSTVRSGTVEEGSPPIHAAGPPAGTGAARPTATPRKVTAQKMP